jgi:tetratricopeptide (TPR) repeat protein
VPSDAGVASVTEDAADVAPTAVAPAPTSELPEQIELYEAARAAGARGAFADGLTKLDDLLQRFPQTPLRPDAELTRADLLSRAGRLDDAALALDALASSPAHRGRRGELLRTLGDVHRQRKDCKAAMEAYTLAQTVTLGTAEKAKVARGIEACAPPR